MNDNEVLALLKQLDDTSLRPIDAQAQLLLTRRSVRRTRLRRYGAVVLIAVGAVSVGGVTVLTLQPHDPSNSSVAGAELSPSASVSEVAAAYMRAAQNRNCSLTAEMTLDHTWSWCNDPKLHTWHRSGRIINMPAAQTGKAEACVPFEIATTGSRDGSIPSGNTPWDLCFVHTGSGWRLYDQGHI